MFFINVKVRNGIQNRVLGFFNLERSENRVKQHGLTEVGNKGILHVCKYKQQLCQDCLFNLL